MAGERQMWQMASASASAASAGLGGASSRSSLVTMAPTWSFPARPLPVTAALTSLGVCKCTGRPRRDAHRMATALAWAVPITVRTLCWLKTRSTATASGRCSSSHASRPRSISTSRWPMSASAGVRITPTPAIVSARPGTPSTTPTPHRVSPGSTPSTRMPPPSRARPPPSAPLANLFVQVIGWHRQTAEGPTGCVPSAPPDRPSAAAQASTFSMTSSETSKLAKTFCTSSLSSSASISLKILRAPSSSNSTCMVGRKLASAES